MWELLFLRRKRVDAKSCFQGCCVRAFVYLCCLWVFVYVCCLQAFVYCSRGVQHDGVIKILACCPHSPPPLPSSGMKMMKIRLTSTKTSHDGRFIVWADLHEDESDGRLFHKFVRLWNCPDNDITILELSSNDHRSAHNLSLFSNS